VQFSAGWCAGVRIALLGDGHPDKTLLDYLQHELFSTLPAELADAWRVLAHLPRFNAGLCEHLFGHGDGDQYLRDLQALGAFIQPWEDTDWLQVFRPWPNCCAMNPGRPSAPGIDAPASGSPPNRTGRPPSSRRCWPKNMKWR
jgi:hypothetical protein